MGKKWIIFNGLGKLNYISSQKQWLPLNEIKYRHCKYNGFEHSSCFADLNANQRCFLVLNTKLIIKHCIRRMFHRDFG